MKFESELHCYNYCRKILKNYGFNELQLLSLGQGFQQLCFEIYYLDNDYDYIWTKISLQRPIKVLLTEFNKIEIFTVNKVLEHLLLIADIFTLYDRIAKNTEDKEAFDILYKLYGKFDFQSIKKKFVYAEELEDVAGIYFLYDNEKRLVYIGKSINLASRMISSIREKSNKLEKPIEYFKIGLVRNKSHLDIYESYYIAKHKPIANRVGIYDEELDIVLSDLEFTNLMNVSVLYVEEKDNE